MKKVEHYVCEICGTEYAEKNKCENCEINHKKPFHIERSEYRSITQDASGYPQFIDVRMDGGKLIRYKRLKSAQ